MTEEVPFWRRKTLAEMTDAEWESLCDGCGRCCLVKLEEDLVFVDARGSKASDGDNGRAPGRPLPNPRIFFTDVGCKLLDAQSCRCRDYPNRSTQVPDCLRLTPDVVTEIGWLPPTCGYRLVAEGRDLYWWHPLVSMDPDSVHDAGVSVRGRVSASEEDVAVDDLEERIASWPLRLPKRARQAPDGRPEAAVSMAQPRARGKPIRR